MKAISDTQWLPPDWIDRFSIYGRKPPKYIWVRYYFNHLQQLSYAENKFEMIR